MNGNRVLTMPCATTSKDHSSGVSDFQSNARPESLVPGNRRFPGEDTANLWSPCSNCSSDENNSPTAINSINWDKPALEDKALDFGWTAPQVKTEKRASHKTPDKHLRHVQAEKKPSGYVNVRSGETKDLASLAKSSPKKEKKKSTGKTSDDAESVDGGLGNPADQDDETTDMRSEEEIQREKEDLRNVAWFQAGIPREIALEVLAEKPEGSFIVRESTTKPGCYALSLRVPPGKNPTGIAHYLILQTNKGYKIKGFTKEFSSLSSLITHHSVMPELLPCTLSVPRKSTRDAEHEFEETEQKTCDIFADIHWLMTDLEM